MGKLGRAGGPKGRPGGAPAPKAAPKGPPQPRSPKAKQLVLADANAKTKVSPQQQTQDAKFGCPDRFEPHPSKPCDVAELKVTVVPAKIEEKQQFPGQARRDTFDTAKPKIVTVVGADNPAGKSARDAGAGPWTSGQTLRIVGSSETAPAATYLDIVAKSDVGFCGAKHPLLTVSTDGITKSFKSTTQKVRVWRPSIAQSIPQVGTFTAIFSRFWPSVAPHKTFVIAAQSHGYRTDNKPAVGVIGLIVEVYADDSFSLQVKIPSLAKKAGEYGRSIQWKMGDDGIRRFMSDKSSKSESHLGVNSKSKESSKAKQVGGTHETYEYKEEKTQRMQGLHVTKYSSEYKATKTADTISRQSTGSTTYRGEVLGEHAVAREYDRATRAVKPVEVEDKAELLSEAEGGFEFHLLRKRDGETKELDIDAVKLVRIGIDAYTKFKDLWNQINDFVPQVGWKFTYDMSFFAGTIEALWKPAITDTGDIFTAFSIQAEIEIFKIEVTFSFGFKAEKMYMTFELIAEGKVGGSGKVSGGGEYVKPGSMGWKLGGEAKAEASIELRATAGSPHFARASGKATTSLTAKLSIKEADEEKIDPKYGIQWEGLMAEVTWTLVGLIDKQDKYHLIDRRTLRAYGAM